MTGLGDLPLGIFESSARGVERRRKRRRGPRRRRQRHARPSSGTRPPPTLTPLAPLLAGRHERTPTRVSGNGFTAVGSSDSTLGVQAASWLGAGAPVPLGDLTGGAFRSQALAVSGDGLTIVGDSDSANGREAFRLDGH